MRSPTNEQMVDALRRANGFVSVAAKALGCSRRTIERRVARVPALREVLEDARVAMLDFAEGALVQRMKAGDVAAIIFYLKTQGRARGYVQNPEVAVNVAAVATTTTGPRLAEDRIRQLVREARASALEEQAAACEALPAPPEAPAGPDHA